MFGGFGPHLSNQDKSIIKMLGELNKYRGDDSTGIFTTERAAKKPGFITRIRKDVVDSTAFFRQTGTKELLKAPVFLVAGHTRAATHGSVSVPNAHPYQVGHYVGMHNGIINSFFDSKKDKTDSQVLFERINANGVIPAIQEGLKARGDMALVFINKSNNTLNFFRNNGRPLFIAKLGTTFFWSSTKDSLEFAAKQHGKTFEELWSLKTMVLNTTKLGTIKWDITEVPEPKYPPISSSKWPTMLVDPSKACAYDPPTPLPAAGVARYGTYLRTCTPVTLPKITVERPKLSGVRVQVGKNSFLQINEVNQLIKKGCAWCNANKMAVTNPLYFYNDTEFLCQECHEDKETVETLFSGISFFKSQVFLSSGVPFVKRKPEKDDGELPF